MKSTTIDTARVSAEEAYEIAMEAYSFFYPIVTMDVSREQMTNLAPDIKPGFGPANRFNHIRSYPDADFKSVVRPNFDTLYSSAWIDLTDEPVLLSIPDSNGRYYLMPILDMWTDVLASPGWRTSGTGPQLYALVPAGYKGPLPEGAEPIEATSRYLWIIGRTKTDGPADYESVHEFQNGLSLTPLSLWGKEPVEHTFIADQSIDMKTPPLDIVNSMSAEAYFQRAARLLGKHGAHLTDWSILARLRKIGIVAGEEFNWRSLETKIAESLERGTRDCLQLMARELAHVGTPVNGWLMNLESIGVYGNNYLKRAIVSMVGLGANQPEDAIYPLNFADASGQPLSGEKRYVLHFDKTEMPPVHAFWSVTMYDADGFQVANALNRFAISSWMPLSVNDDGSLDIYIQHENPGKEKEANWLPSPSQGKLGVTMRLYAPRPQVMNKDWNPPAIRPAE